MGLEPTQSCLQWILSPSRIPIPPLQHLLIHIIIHILIFYSRVLTKYLIQFILDSQIIKEEKMKKIIIVLFLIFLLITLIEAEEYKISPLLKETLLINNGKKDFYQRYEWWRSFYKPFINLDKMSNISFLSSKLSTSTLKINTKKYQITNIDFEIWFYVNIIF